MGAKRGQKGGVNIDIYFDERPYRKGAKTFGYLGVCVRVVTS